MNNLYTGYQKYLIISSKPHISQTGTQKVSLPIIPPATTLIAQPP
jgi:hypothetical protein